MRKPARESLTEVAMGFLVALGIGMTIITLVFVVVEMAS